MTQASSTLPVSGADSHWLRTYYFLRAGVSVAWIVLAVFVATTQSWLGAVLLVLYPAWDAVANVIDARKTGGLNRNRAQALNAAVSLLTAAAVFLALVTSALPVLAVFGVWAFLAGAFQLVIGLRRWKTGGQWAMVLSGGQSMLAGVFFVIKSGGTDLGLAAATVAPYAGFGAFYFLISAIWLTVKARRSAPARLA